MTSESRTKHQAILLRVKSYPWVEVRAVPQHPRPHLLHIARVPVPSSEHLGHKPLKVSSHPRHLLIVVDVAIPPSVMLEEFRFGAAEDDTPVAPSRYLPPLTWDEVVDIALRPAKPVCVFERTGNPCWAVRFRGLDSGRCGADGNDLVLEVGEEAAGVGIGRGDDEGRGDVAARCLDDGRGGGGRVDGEDGSVTLQVHPLLETDLDHYSQLK